MQFIQRIKKLQQMLTVADCDAFLVEEQTNLYYLTGHHLSAGSLLVDKQEAHLIVDNRYFEACVKTAPCRVILADKTPLEALLSSREFAFLKVLGFDSATTTVHRYQELQNTLKLQFMPLNNPIKSLRMIKDAEEINFLRESANLCGRGFDYISSSLQEGISELDAACALEIFWKQQGSQGLAFNPIIAFGTNSSMPHYRAGNVRLKKGMPVLIDIGVNFRNYHSDMTRMVFFGEPDPKIPVIHAIVEQAQQKALALCRPNTLISQLDDSAREYIKSQGYGDFFSHGLGHGVGLEIHELPVIRNKEPFKDVKLEAGMVLTIEPGIYLPGVGGVRIEDTVVITSSGHENLTQRSTKPILK
jgi:Xaa-Pro aminopeptidase